MGILKAVEPKGNESFIEGLVWAIMGWCILYIIFGKWFLYATYIFIGFVVFSIIVGLSLSSRKKTQAGHNQE